MNKRLRKKITKKFFQKNDMLFRDLAKTWVDAIFEYGRIEREAWDKLIALGNKKRKT